MTIVAHTIRITAIYERNREIMTGLSALLTIQIVITAVACGFYRCKCLCYYQSLYRLSIRTSQLFPWRLAKGALPVRSTTGLGCIGLLQLSSTLFLYVFLPLLDVWNLTSFKFALAVIRSIQSLEVKPMGLWDVTIRDGLHFYCVSVARCNHEISDFILRSFGHSTWRICYSGFS